MTSSDLRFSGVSTLFQESGLSCLKNTHILIAGIGGVGSWTAEALARSGVGELTLVDLDEICISNVNRQLHALDGEIGKAKIEVMSERIKKINPECRVNCVLDFLSADNLDTYIHSKLSGVVDCIDGLDVKCALVLRCKELDIPLVCVGGAGGIHDPQNIKVSDLAYTTYDPLLLKMRKFLRSKHRFPGAVADGRGRGKKFGVDAVYHAVEVKDHSSGGGGKLDCAGGLGSASFVTGSFGFFAASQIIKRILDNEIH
ncbi:MAG: tRNA threonylcarbamoyladenosine dehydratase [Bacteriovoracaceae bacterium]|jgi:tRNA threonylcarbamoyladenosine dehydratase|nr:tRNA threonylcarbamoyladenosine dehydratase [Bacteriovoracaceae bacterium]